jgi:hypothetical protein
MKLSLFGDDSDGEAAEDGSMDSQDEEDMFAARRSSHAGASTRGASGFEVVDLLDSSRAYIALHVSTRLRPVCHLYDTAA